MGIFKGGALRLFQSFLYLINFCCAAIILGIYSYFLSVLADRNLYINNDLRAVEGLSGAAVVYTIFAVLLTCCLGGVSFFAFLAIVLDVCFIGAMIAIAVLTREGAYSCSGVINTPLGYGPANDVLSSNTATSGTDYTIPVRNGTACRLNKACFAVSIIGAFFFLITALMQIALVRNHKKEKRFGPSPSNNYTSGYGRRKGLFARKNKDTTRDAEVAGAGGLAAAHPDTRPSHETGYTGTTVGGANAYTNDKVEPATGNHTGYYNAPTGTGATNPYTTTGTATNY